MKKSFMTRALAMGLSLAMAFSLSAATNVSVASAAATPAMASKQFAVRVGGASKSYKASTATQKSFRITKATVGNTDKATVSVNSSRKSLKVTPGTVTGTTVVTVTFKNIKTAKSTAKKYRCVVKAAVEPEKPVEPEVVKATKIAEAKVLNAKTISVTFDGVVDTSTATAIKVARGTTPITVTAKYAADAKSVTLTSDTSFAAGTYSVTVGSFEPASLNITKQTPTSLKILNTKVANKANARVYFQVLDQYGEAMTNYNDSKLKVSAYNVTKGHVINPGNESKKDYFELQCNTETSAIGVLNAIGDKISVVAYLKDNASISCTTELEIVRVYTDELEFGDIKLGDDKRVTVDRTYEIPYTAKDSEGGEVTFNAKGLNVNDDAYANGGTPTSSRDTTVQIDNYNFVSSNITAVNMNNVTVDADGKLHFIAGGTAGTAVITAINLVTGKTSTITIKVNNPATLSSLDIADASVACNANNGDKFKAAVTAYDQFGEVIDPKNVKNVRFFTGGQYLTTDFNSITVTPSDGIRINKITSDGKYVEYEVIDHTKLVKDQKVNFDFVSKEMGDTGYIRSSSVVSVDDEIEASALEIVKAPDATVAENGKVSLQFAVKDQYQNKMTLTNLGSTAEYVYDAVHGDKYVVSVRSTNGVTTGAAVFAAGDDSNVYKVTVQAPFVSGLLAKNGYYTLEVKDGAKVIASKMFNLSVVDSISKYGVEVDQWKYKAGDTIKVTVDAYSALGFNGNYNGTDVVDVVVSDGGINTKTYTKTIKFEKGVATFDLTAGTKSASDYNITVTNKNANAEGGTAAGTTVDSHAFKIVANSASKLAVDKSDGKLVIQDSQGNDTDGSDRTAYATFKVMDENLNSDITSSVTIGSWTSLKTDKTIEVEIDGATNKIDKIDGSTYSLSSLVISNIPATATNHNLVLTITVEGLTWEKKVHYTGGGSKDFADADSAQVAADTLAGNYVTTAFNTIKTSSVTTATDGSISFTITSCASLTVDGTVTKSATASGSALGTGSTSITPGAINASLSSIATAVTGGSEGDYIIVKVPVKIVANATVAGVLGTYNDTKYVEIKCVKTAVSNEYSITVLDVSDN